MVQNSKGRSHIYQNWNNSGVRAWDQPLGSPALTPVMSSQLASLHLIASTHHLSRHPAGFGAKLSPEQGCVSSIKCLFAPVTSGWYYGSDGLRGPLTMTRDPGTPEYQGEPEADIDAKVYNK